MTDNKDINWIYERNLADLTLAMSNASEMVKFCKSKGEMSLAKYWQEKVNEKEAEIIELKEKYGVVDD